MQKVPELSPDPNFDPIYAWENLPTIVIVWDIHWWNDKWLVKALSKNGNGKIGGNIVEWNEWPELEVNAVNKLQSKFNISTTFLENEYNDWTKEFRTLIWKWLSNNKNLNLIKLENPELHKKAWDLLDLIQLDKIRDIYELIDDKEALNTITYDNLTSDDFTNTGVLSLIFSYQKSLIEKYKTELFRLKAQNNKESFDKNIKKIKSYKDGEIKDIMRKALIDSWEKLTWDESELNLYIKINNLAEDVILNQRNESFVWKMNPKPWETVSMVVWKAHIPWLIEKFKAKYKWKVNIYVAK